jgi:hypothetical protein
MSITNIRTRRKVEIDADEIRMVIQFAMGAQLKNDDPLRFEFVDSPKMSCAAGIWNVAYADRHFVNIESALAVMMDVIGEQISLATIRDNEEPES